MISRWFGPEDERPDCIVVDGVEYVRDGARMAGRGEGLQVVPDSRPMVSHSSPRWHGKNEGRGFYDSYTSDGKPIISSRAALREAQSRAAWHGETINRVRDLE